MSQEEFEERVVDRRDAGFVNRGVLRYDAESGGSVIEPLGSDGKTDVGGNATEKKKKGKGKWRKKEGGRTEKQDGEAKMKDGKTGCGCWVM